MTIMNMVDAINLALKQEMQKDKTVVVLGEDVGIDGGVFRVTDGLYKMFGENRVLDTPLAESGIVGVSIGMAINGFKPVAEIQFDGFLPPTFDQLLNHASRMRNRSRSRYHVPLVVRLPYGGGVKALEHHSDSPEAFLCHMPGLKVVIPSNPYDAKGLLVSAIRDPDPVVFLEPKRMYRAVKMEVPEDEYTVPLGEAKVVREGYDVTLIAWGAMVRTANEAADKLKDKASAEVVDVRTLNPLDEKTILNSVKKTGRVVIIHEAQRTGGFGAEIAAVISEKAMLNLKSPIQRVTGWDVIFPLPKLENYYLPNADRIIKAVEHLMEF